MQRRALQIISSAAGHCFVARLLLKTAHVSPSEEHEAWLEREGQEHVLPGNCSIGRATPNTLVLESPKVSRLHAIVHSERGGAFWLVDLGSSNGTFLNKRRIHFRISSSFVFAAFLS